ncbi:MAG: phosphoglycerate dehydrogenase [Wenzhouxiangellaceae bacterium]
MTEQTAQTYSLAKDKIKFLLLEGVHARAAELIEQAGYHQLVRHNATVPREQLLETLQDVHFLGIRSRTQLDSEILQAAPKLAAVGCFCIGTNQVDLAAAQRLGIPVFNAPYANTRSVAELALAEIIMLMRGIPSKNAAAHRGGWLKSARHSYEVRGKTLGIVGYGHIGTQLGILAESLGMQVLYYDIVNKLPLGNARAADNLEQLLGNSDVVSLHVPATDETEWMMGAAQFQQMRRGAYLINASRGTVVDIAALRQALESEQLAGAAIDVFPKEPRSNDDTFVSELRGLDQVILTPHIGGSTLEAQENIALEVADKLVRYSDNGSTLSAVNFPEVSLPDHAGARRILHIHRNEAGVLQQINQVFSANGINILGQHLQTRGEIGYVVMDIAGGDSETLLQQLREVPATIRCRVLF